MKQIKGQLLLFLLAAMLLVGCQEKEDRSLQGEAKIPQTIVGVFPEGAGENRKDTGKEQEKSTEEERVESIEDTYAVVSVEIREEKVSLTYPQISGMENTSIQDKWNRMIQEGVDAILKQGPWTGEVEGSYEVKTQNEKLLSLLLRGEYYQEGMAYPQQFLCTFNIDMVTGNNIRLAEQWDVDALAKTLLSGSGYRVSGELEKDFQERIEILYGNAAQLAEILADFDYRGTSDLAPGYSYEEEGETHLCMQVPQALGGYVDVTLEAALAP
ncbi:MAG: DUF4163 domain-containing protein [Lachnospiraceae bacterium]|nr:DUF4163 domain-containing protein [Lachnospiraceae bacterium]